jgi:hypothetical protein
MRDQAYVERASGMGGKVQRTFSGGRPRPWRSACRGGVRALRRVRVCVVCCACARDLPGH